MAKIRVPNQTRGIETRKKLVASALKLFKKLGYENVSVAKIAATAKVAVGSYYLYFEDKKQIFIEVLEEYYNEFLRLDFAKELVESLKAPDFSSKLMKVLTQMNEYVDSFGELSSSINSQYFINSEIREVVQNFELKICSEVSKFLLTINPQLSKESLETKSFMIFSFVDMITLKLHYPNSKLNTDLFLEEATFWVKNSLQYLIKDQA
jgi:AcrR family transcriptional regulator